VTPTSLYITLEIRGGINQTQNRKSYRLLNLIFMDPCIVDDSVEMDDPFPAQPWQRPVTT